MTTFLTRRLTRMALVLVGAAGLAACEGEAPVPASPTWVDDVEPILRGSCFHCHGAGARPDMANRWDVYDPAAPSITETGVKVPPEITAAGTTVRALQFWALTMDHKSEGRMPPPPADPLPARDVEVLKRWAAAQPMPGRGTRRFNGKPAAAWLNIGKTFEVYDPDGEQVLGKITCGATSADLLRSGAHALPMGATPPCTLALSDGQDKVNVELK